MYKELRIVVYVYLGVVIIIVFFKMILYGLVFQSWYIKNLDFYIIENQRFFVFLVSIYIFDYLLRFRGFLDFSSKRDFRIFNINWLIYLSN